MNTQSNNQIVSEDNFYEYFNDFVNKNSLKNLDIIEINYLVEEGLKTAYQIDTSYRKSKAFMKSNGYLLYKVVFELWSYQHQIILNNIKDTSSQAILSQENQLIEHKDIIVKLINSLESLASIDDAVILRNSWLLAWKQAIDDMDKFMASLLTSSKNRKRMNFSSKVHFPSVSPEMRYVIIATCTFVIGILIATLLLIN
ncbi:hypothetical protein H6G20_13375 [Desertifilum sp. FACHB-1129]|uniref:hypothetical protein n=1 Tax=Desertifilum TaxID=1185872 RepID=UPI00114D2C14|nr:MULTISPECIES: hypothetical protein [Desertifilum]MBD2312655.1 hypothetical protein [Desertifilum sp. FACHB-1129]MBD2320445.1 hypothetical protein [Desertifilum sp. FACHB-866]MBD2330573.1 hypothetical protein [Desertifilum sp. FACHB-868]MDA0210040.1 hypothetical protein [Cyanobacteria bacterium FC1]